ncbi:hypothetical protein RHSIM_Rhsim04G0073900 [Rhododendron simsii]|uniref:Uncharacterized protein n=1 Tax=Rhododendron simsii TaxID=118357 RepID=A0A834H6F9_RHOSS|nr:hypothetical protein RHSIM_Rhsim04G0073900 [Rhododendron simsii]
MITMEAEGITWVGDIYHKFEAMCLEVEEVVCEDTVKYVENQVQSVGATVKKFYSDVIQDLLPPLDLSELPSADLSLNRCGDFGVYKTPEASINAPMCREIADNHESCDQISRTSYSDTDMGGDMRVGETFCNDAVHSSVSIADASIENPTDMILPVEPCEAKETELRSSYSIDRPGTCKNSGGIFPEELNAGGDTLNEEDTLSHRGRSGEWNSNSNLVDNCGLVEIGIDTIKQIEHLKLEETCILVDGDQLGLNPSRQDKPRSYNRSYKVLSLSLSNNSICFQKKFREAFSLKSSARKHEYEQLAAQYENMETGSNHIVAESMMPTLSGDANKSNLPAHDFCESEWELL